MKKYERKLELFNSIISKERFTEPAEDYKWFRHLHNPSWIQISNAQKDKGRFYLITLSGNVFNIQDFSKVNALNILPFFVCKGKKNNGTVDLIVERVKIDGRTFDHFLKDVRSVEMTYDGCSMYRHKGWSECEKLLKENILGNKL